MRTRREERIDYLEHRCDTLNDAVIALNQQVKAQGRLIEDLTRAALNGVKIDESIVELLKRAGMV